MISPKAAKDIFQLDLADRRQADDYEVYADRHVINVKVGGKELSCPR